MKYEEGYQQGYLDAKETLEAVSSQSVAVGRGGLNVGLDMSSHSPSFGNVGSRDREKTPPPNPERFYSPNYSSRYPNS